MLPEGRYSAVCVSACVTETKSGKEFVSAEFRVARGELAGETVSWSGWLHTDKTADRTINSLRAMGFAGTADDLASGDLGELLNEVSIVVEHADYEGKTSARVAWVNPLKRTLAPDKAKALADRLRAKAAAAPIVPHTPSASGDPFGDESDDTSFP